MIYYNNWLSNDPKLNLLKGRENEIRAAWMYAATKPLRVVAAAVELAFSNGWNAWRMRSRRRADLRELNRLDDRLLQDIGIFRGQIPGIVRGESTSASQIRASSRLRKLRTVKPVASKAQACEVIVLYEPHRAAKKDLASHSLEALGHRTKWPNCPEERSAHETAFLNTAS